MRISTNTIYDTSTNAMLRQQSDMLHTQQQVASGKRMLTAADDPLAAAQALQVGEADAANAQYAVNRKQAQHALGMSESVLQSVTALLQDAKVLAVNGGNATLGSSDRAVLATELRGKLEQLLGLANSTDGAGQYLFAGYRSTTVPFSVSGNAVAYAGDAGQRSMQVAASRTLEVSVSGTAVFERIKDGNGVFAVAANAANNGTGISGQGVVTNAAALTGHDYAITFTVSGGATTYDVVDQNLTPPTTGTAILAAQPFVNVAGGGGTLSFDGLQFDISGNPANGDVFAVSPSRNQSVFQTFNDLISTLEKPAGNASERTALSNGLNRALQNLDHALDNVLGVRAGLGTRLRELDTLDLTGQDLSLQYRTTLSELQDVDYAAAISNLTRQQLYLEAAQKSFVKVSGLSLFNFV